MANLTRTYRWERFAPDIGDNLELPEGERLELEVASGLTGEQLAAHLDALRTSTADVEPAALPEAFSKVLSPYVRLVGSHTIDGRPVTTLQEYLGVVMSMAGIYNVRELASVVSQFNSVEGTSELFSKRRSGGSRTTRAPSAATPAGGR